MLPAQSFPLDTRLIRCTLCAQALRRGGKMHASSKPCSSARQAAFTPHISLRAPGVALVSRRPRIPPCAVALSKPLLSKPRLTYVGLLQASIDGMSPDKTQFGDRLEGHMVPPRISRSDQQFLDMGLEFVSTREGIVLSELNDLFEKVGFPRRDPEKLKVALENTYHLIWIRATRQSRLAKLGQMVGFARATSDGVLSATIWDVAILPAWQRCGLGRALMERLTARLVVDEIPTITLYAEPAVVGLYEKLGFMKDPDGIRGMAFQRKRKQPPPPGSQRWSGEPRRLRSRATLRRSSRSALYQRRYQQQ